MIAIDEDVRSSASLAFRPERITDALAVEAVKRLRDWIPELLQAASTALDAAACGSADTNAPPDGPEGHLSDARIHLSLMAKQVMALEQRWTGVLDRGIRAWPTAPDGPLSLLSDGMLDAQMLAQPVVEMLDRRFANPLAVINSRYAALAAAKGVVDMPSPPTSPAALVHALLQVFPAQECPRVLRERLVRTFLQMAMQRLGGFYDWLNGWLADQGLAMSDSDRHGLQVTRRIGTAPPGALAGTAPVGRDETARPGPAALALLRRGRQSWQSRQAPAAAADDRRRAMSDTEFQAVLSLAQTEGPDPDREGVGQAVGLEGLLLRVAGGLGMAASEVRFADAQRDASEVASLLIGEVCRQGAFDAEGARALSALGLPLTLAIWQSPAMLDDAGHPVRRCMAALVSALDGQRGGDVLHGIAVALTGQVARDFNGDPRPFRDVLERLETERESHERKARLLARRALQAMDGRERRVLAAGAVHAAQQGLPARETVRPAIARFLQETWPVALERVWLREGADSEAFLGMQALGHALMTLDQAASSAMGASVADGLLEAEADVRRACMVAGLDQTAADALVGALVAELAEPDAVRVEWRRPAAGRDLPDAMRTPACVLQPGERVVLAVGPDAPRALLVVGATQCRGSHLLLDPEGAQIAIEPDVLAAARDQGRLRRTGSRGLWEDVVAALVAGN
ncbi:DUF1631 family protein [Lysobacter sp. SG-8]|uniref:DUF1631 family protein n=1 Tax=Marilutibacter penaei TaxID=2759900 RepID=A0A7W3YEI2_9GAMM|nr:DUF1631 family protein [Lysobacter penaei]MBB1088443.1 DUF1631 family protein [Lysobacter penaei]